MSEYQETLRNYKERIFAGEEFSGAALSAAKIPTRVSDAWRRTRKLGVPMALDSIPPASKESGVLKRLTGITKQTWAVAQDEYYDIGALLAAFGAALYFLDDRLAVYNYIGDQKLIASLKQRGLKFSYSFAESYVGVTPASLAQRGDGLVSMCGEEHPIDLLSGYYTTAVAVRRQTIAPFRLFDTSMYESDYVCYCVLPLEKYSEQSAQLLRVILQKIIPNCGSNASNRLYADMFVLTEETNKTPTIFLSPECKVIYVNRQFEHEFGTNFSLCTGLPVEDVVPELSFLRDTLKKQQKLKFQKTPINVRGTERNYYLETRFLRNPGGSVNSMRVSISTQGNVDYYLKNLNPGGNVAVYTFDSIMGEDPEFLRAKRVAERAAASSSSVLITGESGVGKELLAQAIHNGSERRDGPFVAINCGSIPRELLGSELFGYESGAFTGAKKEGQTGKIELARGGTLFLDEITEMPLDMQSYLLRVIEERKLYRLGGNKPQSVDVRIIAATNRDILEYVEEGRFRQDLYFRLNVIKVCLPPLRDRPGDIPLLADYYVQRLSRELGRSCDGLEPAAMDILRRHSWPGNIRELRNAIEYSINMIDSGPIRPDDLPDEIVSAVAEAAPAEKPSDMPGTWSGDYKSWERAQIRRMMLQFKGNKSRVAREIGISRNTLNKRLRDMHYE